MGISREISEISQKNMRNSEDIDLIVSYSYDHIIDHTNGYSRRMEMKRSTANNKD